MTYAVSERVSREPTNQDPIIRAAGTCRCGAAAVWVDRCPMTGRVAALAKNAADLLVRWGRLHAVRTALSGAFLLLVIRLGAA
jgi:hypothetical protein